MAFGATQRVEEPTSGPERPLRATARQASRAGEQVVARLIEGERQDAAPPLATLHHTQQPRRCLPQLVSRDNKV
jgi:hypothetical protein